VVAFYPEQIKSIFNPGEFDPDDPRILKQVVEKGGEGSGNFGHAGRPGEVGGSAPKGSPAGVGSGIEKPKSAKQLREAVRVRVAGDNESMKKDMVVFHELANKLKDLPHDAMGDRNRLLEEMSVLSDSTIRTRYKINDTVIQELRNFVDGGTVPYDIDKGGFMDERDGEEIDNAMEVFGDIVRSDLFGDPVTITSSDSDRSAYSPKSNAIYLNGLWQAGVHGTVFHEMGHYIETMNKDVLNRLIEFYERRTAHDAEVEMSGMDGEYTKRDNFFDEYVGKVYKNDRGEIEYTEILSMGLELLIKKPYEFMEKDPEHFDLIISIITGLPEDITTKGGAGSGNFGHAGRPGEVGGSAPKDGIRTGTGGGDGGKTDDPLNLFGGGDRKRIYKNVSSFLDKHPDITISDIDTIMNNGIKLLKEKYPDENTMLDSDEMGDLWNIRHILRDEFEFRIRRDISSGKMTVEEAIEKGGEFAVETNGSEWRPLPETLWHTTTNIDGIELEGLKSRYERGITTGLGLGGGEDDVICLTDREDYAKTIERSLHEMHMIHNG
jgi:hypothetical protein